MRTSEDNYLDMLERENLLAELTAGSGAALGEADLEIEGTSPVSDDVIEREVRAVLQGNPLVPFDRLVPRVRSGWVSLDGRVDHAYEKQEAEAAVLDLDHVRGLIDHIAVSTRG